MSAGAFAPLARPLFRSIWIASLASNLGTWMQNVGAAWLMTSLAPSPVFVSLVQAATNLPLFLLALPAGALADVVDRRRLMLIALAWLCAATGTLGALAFAERVTPASLLACTFAIGLGAALLAPAFQALVPELVPADEVAPAVSLNGISMNLGRAAGPALGGLVVATLGAGATFLLNAASFVAVAAAVYRWQRAPREGRLPPEDLFGAMRSGLRYVRFSRALQTVLWRTAGFVLPASAIWALLPLHARGGLGLGATGFGVLLGCFGAGAVVAGVVMNGVRARLGANGFASAGAFVFAAASAVLGIAPNPWLAGAALFAAGGAWLSVLTTMNASAQIVIPPWVRARALATYLLVMFGGLALGSALWGALAQGVGVADALVASGAAVALGRLATWRHRLPEGAGPDLSPAPRWPEPLLGAAIEGDRGPVLVTLEYEIDPKDTEPFARAMRALGDIRLRDGALRWGLWADSERPGRYLESFVVESWLAHLRQHERVTAADRAVQRIANAFHRGAESPRVTHFVHERIPSEP
ncbi:MAG: MFS transporter [Proteobacteria bacterium]|nr:MAG: MFS transporter [Pseudomonadota bacterium]